MKNISPNSPTQSNSLNRIGEEKGIGFQLYILLYTVFKIIHLVRTQNLPKN